MQMFNLFGVGYSPSLEESPQTPMQERLLEVVNQYKDNLPLPPMVAPLLNPYLSKLSSLNDETIQGFIDYARALLNYVETGEASGVSPNDATDQNG